MYLGIDLWDKRCWLAIYIEWIVVPKGIIPRTNLINILKKYIKEYKIKVIVVWLPYDLYNKNLRQLEKTKNFISKLKNILPDIEVNGIDERFTSFEADNVLSQMWVKDTKWKKDDISACIILESYLSQKIDLFI